MTMFFQSLPKNEEHDSCSAIRKNTSNLRHAAKLAKLLFKDYRRRVLGLLLMHADKRYHVREIARLTDTVAGTLGLAKQ